MKWFIMKESSMFFWSCIFFEFATLFFSSLLVSSISLILIVFFFDCYTIPEDEKEFSKFPLFEVDKRVVVPHKLHFLYLCPILAIYVILMGNHLIGGGANVFLSPMIAECAGSEESTSAVVPGNPADSGGEGSYPSSTESLATFRAEIAPEGEEKKSSMAVYGRWRAISIT